MNRLNEIRESAGMTQDELAKILGVSKQAINGWEKGSRKIPDRRKNSLATIFGLKESDFDEFSVDLEYSPAPSAEKCIDSVIIENIKRYHSEKRLMSYVDTLYGEGTLTLLKEKREQQKEIERRIHNNFKGRNAITVKDQLTNAERACNLYGHFNNIIDGLLDIKDEEGGNYYYRIIEFLLAMESAMGIDVRDDIKENSCEKYISKSNIVAAEKCFKKALNTHEEKCD
jgi:transcriptional regulator with XRE-family HTH domain